MITSLGVLERMLEVELKKSGVAKTDVLDAFITYPNPSPTLLVRSQGGNEGGDISLTNRVVDDLVDFGEGPVQVAVEVERADLRSTSGIVPVLAFNQKIKMKGGGNLGTAYLTLSAAKIEDELGKMNRLMALVGCGAVLIAAGLCIYLARMVTNPVHILINDMNIVAQGDLNHKTHAHSSDEIGAIAEQFNDMTQQLLQARDAEKEAQRIEDELEMARDIQMTLLPKKIPQIKGLDIEACYFPAKEVGGDYYDFLGIDKEHLGIVVADVSGKGIPGSMVMGTTRTILRFTAAGNPSAADTLARTNRVVAADIRRGMFVTAFYLVLNVRTGEMLAASAGHNPMVVFRAATNDVELVNPNGIALGFDKGVLFDKTIKQQSVKLFRGDRVVLYTDGVVESMDPQSEEYTDERLYEFAKQHKDLSSKEFINALLADVRSHQDTAEQHDDITIVSFRAK
ncbi:MAG: SpoIIE family protein phosphatase, partial [Planctomycetota bacterium]|jgi:sigma-B regulation protein RsbU (phosphoserine phosphatase)